MWDLMPSRPYLDTPLQSIAAYTHGISTLVEYKPGEYGLIACMDLKTIPFRNIKDLTIAAQNGAGTIELEIAIACTVSNLVILKSKNPKELEPFKDNSVSLAESFVIEDEKKVVVYYQNKDNKKNIDLKTKAYNFHFDKKFSFSIEENIQNNELSRSGPVLNKENKLIGYTSAELVNIAIPAFFLEKMLKSLETENTFPSYPTFIGVPFTLFAMTDENIKKASGLDPFGLIGAKISNLYARIADSKTETTLQIGDILLELIDHKGNVYPVNNRTNICLEGTDVNYKAFFDLLNPFDSISLKILRNGIEYIITTPVSGSWPCVHTVSSPRIDYNWAEYLEIGNKIIVANLDDPLISRDHQYYSKELKPKNNKKVVILEIKPAAKDELSSWRKYSVNRY